MSQLWPSQQPGPRNGGRARPNYGRQTIRTEWITPLVLLVLAVAAVAGIAGTVAPFILDTFQQVTDVLPTR